jgi:hypothetical protein
MSQPTNISNIPFTLSSFLDLITKGEGVEGVEGSIDFEVSGNFKLEACMNFDEHDPGDEGAIWYQLDELESLDVKAHLVSHVTVQNDMTDGKLIEVSPQRRTVTLGSSVSRKQRDAIESLTWIPEAVPPLSKASKEEMRLTIFNEGNVQGPRKYSMFRLTSLDDAESKPFLIMASTSFKELPIENEEQEEPDFMMAIELASITKMEKISG